MAAKRGVDLKRGTAASNLSRLKTDGALVHDGQRYRLPEFSRSKSSGGFSSPPAGFFTESTTIAVNQPETAEDRFWRENARPTARQKGS
jgi:hypothetical protein